MFRNNVETCFRLLEGRSSKGSCYIYTHSVCVCCIHEPRLERRWGTAREYLVTYLPRPTIMDESIFFLSRWANFIYSTFKQNVHLLNFWLNNHRFFFNKFFSHAKRKMKRQKVVGHGMSQLGGRGYITLSAISYIKESHTSFPSLLPYVRTNGRVTLYPP